jgi:hypothetical protein
MSMGVDNRFKRVQNRYKSVKSISKKNLILHLKFSKKQILSLKYQFAITFDKKLAKIFLERARAKKKFFTRAKVLLELKIFLLEQKNFFFKTHLK